MTARRSRSSTTSPTPTSRPTPRPSSRTWRRWASRSTSRGSSRPSSSASVYDPTVRDISSTYWSADYPDAQDYFSTNFICGSFLNISHFCDASIDADLAATEAMPFGADRDAALRAVQQRYIDEVAGIPVMEITPQVVWGPRVGDIPTLATYAPYDWKRAWVKP